MSDEGYIKYRCHWQQESIVQPQEIQTLNIWRNQLYQLGLIGQYDDGIGFGNLSCRSNPANSFIISGTQTGGIPHLTPEHYTKVTNFDWQQNYVQCVGAIKASSESLTHGAIYQANPIIQAVIHVHHLELWQSLIDKVPTTDSQAAYGTPQMAREIAQLSKQNLHQKRIIVMSGHREGIITYGDTIQAAGELLLDYFVALR